MAHYSDHERGIGKICNFPHFSGEIESLNEKNTIQTPLKNQTTIKTAQRHQRPITMRPI